MIPSYLNDKEKQAKEEVEDKNALLEVYQENMKDSYERLDVLREKERDLLTRQAAVRFLLGNSSISAS